MTQRVAEWSLPGVWAKKHTHIKKNNRDGQTGLKFTKIRQLAFFEDNLGLLVLSKLKYNGGQNSKHLNSGNILRVIFYLFVIQMVCYSDALNHGTGHLNSIG